MNPVLIPASKLLNLSYNSDVRTNSIKMYGNLLMLGTIHPVLSMQESKPLAAYHPYHSHLLTQHEASLVLFHCYSAAELAKIVLNQIT